VRCHPAERLGCKIIHAGARAWLDLLTRDIETLGDDVQIHRHTGVASQRRVGWQIGGQRRQGNERQHSHARLNDASPI